MTEYVLDENGNVIETIDALQGHSYFEYDPMNRLTKATLNRIDGQNGVTGEQQITIYEYNKNGLLTKQINSATDSKISVYDGNGNLIQITDEDGNVTDYSYDPTNLVNAINYAGGKEVNFGYNKAGQLVEMKDWNGTTNFTLDLLEQITEVNDHGSNITKYSYDSVGNQTQMVYPDNSVAKYEYDLLNRMTKMTDHERQVTNYTYDAVRLTGMAYPNNWIESYEYDANGQKLRQYAQDPTRTASKAIEHTYSYDPNGNILTEYRSGAGGQDKFDLTHSYDELNRLTKTTGLWGFTTHDYTYDSLGNLTYEKVGSKSTDYKYNNLNQQVQKIVDAKNVYNYTFDKRGNLIKGVYVKDGSTTESYVYDATNKVVKGVNEDGEQSHYIYNGMGDLVGNEWIIKANSYGYTGVNVSPSEQVGGVVVCDRHSHITGAGHINPTGKGHTTGGTTGGAAPTVGPKQAVVHKDYVIDYTDPLKRVIMEAEKGAGGLTYRYVYGLEKVETLIKGIPNGAGSVMQYIYNDETGELVLTSTDPGKNVVKDGIVKLYSHQDHLGTTDYITDNVDGKVISYISYDDWDALIKKGVLKMGVRELDLVQDYTGHPADLVLNGIFYAKARMYDASDRRFMAVDPIKGWIADPRTMVQYIYCVDNPINKVDLSGRDWTTRDGEVNQALLEKGKQTLDLNAPINFQLDIERYSRMYKEAAEDNSWLGMVIAADAASYSRQKYYQLAGYSYVDPYDYLHGDGTEVIYIGVHKVYDTPAHHSCVMIFATKQSSFYTHDDFKTTTLSKGLSYVTIGADSNPSEGKLNSNLNRKSDKELDTKLEMIKINVTDKKTMINKLISLGKSFKDGTLDYGFFPATINSHDVPSNREVIIQDVDTYNSNSFTKGLLDAAGITVQKPTSWVPGWEKPVPPSYF